MTIEFHKSILTTKEVKTFELFDYVYPDLGDQYLPYWDENEVIWIYDENEDNWSSVS
ncbi:MAG: hypothetical protein V7K86_05585 [Nostoc sp.]|uniref:hypothetical protein n=1 Tax=Nostoc sp. TaxID=1180 RepID=UPI002FF7185D